MGELLDSVCATAAKQLPAAVNGALDAAADALDTSKATAAAGGASAGKEKTTKAVGAAYHKLKALMDAKHAGWRGSMGGGPRTSAGGRVGWVREENVEDWEASDGTGLAPAATPAGAAAAGAPALARQSTGTAGEPTTTTLNTSNFAKYNVGQRVSNMGNSKDVSGVVVATLPASPGATAGPGSIVVQHQ